MGAAMLRPYGSEGAEEFVEFVGGVEVGFEFAGVEALAEVVEAAGEEVEGGGEDFAIGEDDVAPSGVGAAGEAKGIAEAGTGYGDGQAVFVEMIVKERTKGYGGQLGKMGDHADGLNALRYAANRPPPSPPKAAPRTYAFNFIR